VTVFVLKVPSDSPEALFFMKNEDEKKRG